MDGANRHEMAYQFAGHHSDFVGVVDQATACAGSGLLGRPGDLSLLLLHQYLDFYMDIREGARDIMPTIMRSERFAIH